MGVAPQLAETSPGSVIATPLTAYLRPNAPVDSLTLYRGALTVPAFSGPIPELAALTTSIGVYDLGYRALLKISGADRTRWLNGMVTNTVQSLEDHHSNYNFLLNAQGRILGDATIYGLPGHLLLETDRARIARITAHLDHFIIMDEVELHELDASTTALGVAGPHAPELLRSLGLPIPDESAFIEAQLNGIDVTVAHAYSPLVPVFELWIPMDALPSVWTALTAPNKVPGAVPCGTAALESLRILSGIPLYGVDIQERHLAQETGQTRAVNFNKGCYLGQEIVERIRSRATIHRILCQFSLAGEAPSIEPGQSIPLNAEQAERNPVGELTSLTRVELPTFSGTVALGFIRTEILERKLPVAYSGGAVTPLDAPPQILQN